MTPTPDMPDTSAPEAVSPEPPAVEAAAPETQEAPELSFASFTDLLKQYEQSHSTTSDSGQKQISATIAALTADSALLDIGYKTEGVLPLTAFKPPPAPGDHFTVTVKGRDEDGYYQLSLLKFAQPKDFTSLE